MYSRLILKSQTSEIYMYFEKPVAKGHHSKYTLCYKYHSWNSMDVHYHTNSHM